MEVGRRKSEVGSGKWGNNFKFGFYELKLIFSRINFPNYRSRFHTLSRNPKPIFKLTEVNRSGKSVETKGIILNTLNFGSIFKNTDSVKTIFFTNEKEKPNPVWFENELSEVLLS